MLLGSVVAAALGITCPASLPSGFRPPPAASQLITVEAATARTSYASVRTWRRTGRCWRPVAGPYPARIGRNGLRENRREGDGTTPIGTFGIGRTIRQRREPRRRV